MSWVRDFSKTNVAKCHPEPPAKDLAAAIFAAVICLISVALRTPSWGRAPRGNRSARNAPSKILRWWLRMTALFRLAFGVRSRAGGAEFKPALRN
jgi:hypothetical protein